MSDPTLRRLAAGVLLPGFHGTTVPDGLRRALDDGLAGVCLFGQNVADDAQVTALTTALHAVRTGVLVASDEEGGTVTRLDAGPGSPWPSHGALGALDDVAATGAVATALGRAARARGVDLVLAPVADVGSEPDNPVIGERSFGADPALVSRHVAAFVIGLQREGVAACVKHFPGHGDTRTDSHRALPVVDVDEATWRARDLPPFVAAVEAGALCVMTAHLVLACLDDRPATLSPVVLGRLRDELGFDGPDRVLVTDALDMRAIADGVGRPAGAVQALAAGADLLCVGNPDFPHGYDELADVEVLLDAVVDAVTTGELPGERLEQAAERVARLGERCSPQRTSAVPSDPGLGLDLARRALTSFGRPRLRDGGRLLVAAPEQSMAAGHRPSTLAGLVPGAVAVGESEAGARAHEVEDVAVAVEGRSTPQTRAVVAAVLAARPDAAVVHLGPPDPHEPPPARGIVSHGGGRTAAVAVLEQLGLAVVGAAGEGGER